MYRTFARIALIADKGLRRLQRLVVFASSIAVVALICLVVFLRYVLRTDLYGIEEIVVFVGVWLFFFGASYASQEGEQITTDVIPQYLRSPVFRTVLRFVTTGITLGVCLLATYWAYDWLAWGLGTFPRSPVYEIPMTVTHVAVFASFALMSVYALRDMVKIAIELLSFLSSGRAGS